MENTARNPFKKVFEKCAWGGMPMATISIHEDDLKREAKYDPDDKEKPVYKDIRVEICVAGKCIGTTLDKIVTPIGE